MANGKSTWKYNKLLTVRKNYFSGTQPGTSLMERSTWTNDWASDWRNSMNTVAAPPKANTQGVILGVASNNPITYSPGTSTRSDIIKNQQSSFTLGTVNNNGNQKKGLDWNNPTTNAVASAVGSAIGGVGGSLLSQGMTSTAGNVLGSLQGIASTIPGPWGAALSAGLGLAQGATNLLWGAKFNDENIAQVEGNINNLKSFQSNASNFDALASNWSTAPTAMTFDNDFIGKDGVFSHKVSDKADSLRDQLADASAWVSKSLGNNAENIINTQMSNLEANHAAFGGSLQFSKGGSIHINPENKGKFIETKRKTGKTTEELTHSSNPLTRKRAIFAQNAKKWHHAFGGELNTQGGDFTNGLLYIDNGGSHESNPYEGVPLGVDPEGTPNLVEEGETVFNDYVFSKRLKVPKAIRDKYKLRSTKDMTFAEMSKQMAKESEERPNDPISMRGLEAMMSDLASTQENIKASKMKNSYANGGKVNKFDTGGRKRNEYKGVYGYNDNWVDANGNYIQSYVDMVNARDDAGWNTHFNNQYAYYMNPANKGSLRWQAIDNFYKANPEFKVSNIELTPDEIEWARSGARTGPIGFMHTWDDVPVTPAAAEASATKPAKVNRYLEYGTGTPIEGYFPGRNAEGKTWFDLNPGYEFVDSSGTKRDPIDVDGVSTTYTDYFLRKKEDADPEYKKLPTGLRYAPAVGLGIAAITDAFGLTNKPDYSSADAILEASRGTYQPVKFNPIASHLKYEPFDIDYSLNKLSAEAGATRRNIMNTAGGNRGTAMAGLLAADNNALNQTGNLYRQAFESNLAQKQQYANYLQGIESFNSNGFLQAATANQKALMEGREIALKGTMAAAEMRERARLASEQAKSSNLSGFVTTLGDIGRENMAWNWRNFGLATDSFGNVGDEERLLTHTGKRKTNSGAKGGKIRRKKGLTI